MQSTGGFLDTKARSPVGLGAAIAINGAMIGALLTIGTGVIKDPPTIFTTIEPTIDKAPAPPPDPVPTEVEATRRTPVSVPDVSRPRVPVETTFTITAPPAPPPNPGAGPIETGLERTVLPPAPPLPGPPVLIGPKIDQRFAGALQPPYPAAMIRAELEGVVVVRVLIGPNGRVKRVEKVQAAEEAFFQATVDQAMRKWRFKPATRDGEPVEGWRTMTVRFSLDQSR